MRQRTAERRTRRWTPSEADAVFELENGAEFFSVIEQRLRQASDRFRHTQHGGFVSK